MCLDLVQIRILCMSSCSREDKGALTKLTDTVKTNFNDRFDEVNFYFLCKSHYVFLPAFIRYFTLYCSMFVYLCRGR